MSTISRLIVLILLFNIATGCKKEEAPETPQVPVPVTPKPNTPVVTPVGTPVGPVSESPIGAAGGSVTSADGLVVLTIPAGAFTSDTQVSIQSVTNNAPLGLGLAYRLLPEGVTFSQPVRLTFNYTDQLVINSRQDLLWIVTQASNGSWNAMRSSVLDTVTKTVSVDVQHFSDWSLGKFVDLSLNPASATVGCGQTLSLRIDGFVSPPGDEDIVPLVRLPTDGADPDLIPLFPYYAKVSNMRVSKWILNGAEAPVSGSNGALSGSGISATYTAPAQLPAVNPVSVSAQLEISRNDQSTAPVLLLFSNIQVVDDRNFFLAVNVDGQSITYTQWGANGQEQPENASLAGLGVSEDHIGIVCGQPNSTNGLILGIDNPALGSRPMTKDGDENILFIPDDFHFFGLSYTKRTPQTDGSCETESKLGVVTFTLTEFTGATGSFVAGSFSGTLYEDKPGYQDDCITPDQHTIEGEFRLKIVN